MGLEPLVSTGSILLAILALLGYIRHDNARLRAEVKQDIGALRAEVKGEITTLRTEVKQDIGALRAEVKEDLRGLIGVVVRLDQRVYDLATGKTQALIVPRH